MTNQATEPTLEEMQEQIERLAMEARSTGMSVPITQMRLEGLVDFLVGTEGPERDGFEYEVARKVLTMLREAMAARRMAALMEAVKP